MRTREGDLGQRLRIGPGHLLDLDAALDRAHGQESALSAVEQE